MNLIKSLFQEISFRARSRRADLFRKSFNINEDTRILDLGSETGSNINFVLAGSDADPKNVYIADIDDASVAHGAAAYGFVPVHIDESETLPFPDKFFDIVYCSSVIEHVTLPKEEVWTVYSGKKFRKASQQHQRAFAQEIRRIGRGYFVQCPYKYFPIESHSWLPFLAWMPRRIQILVLHLTNKFWIKKTSPDWLLLSKRELSELFAGAEILEEKYFGLTKSIMAVQNDARFESNTPGQ